MQPFLSHVALLVSSAENTASLCKKSGYEIGPVEDFPSEGTREVYVGPPEAQGLLLLMQAAGPGPYQTALKKRGPGLHHIAVTVGSIDEYVAGLSGSGWLLHPTSLHTLAHRKTVYLARPGMRALIEVQQAGKGLSSQSGPRFVSEVFVAGDREHQRLLDALGVSGLRLAGKDGPGLVINGKPVAIGTLAGL